jgi:hypothetical protein
MASGTQSGKPRTRNRVRSPRVDATVAPFDRRRQRAVSALWDALGEIIADHADERGTSDLPEAFYRAGLRAMDRAAVAFPELRVGAQTRA